MPNEVLECLEVFKEYGYPPPVVKFYRGRFTKKVRKDCFKFVEPKFCAALKKCYCGYEAECHFYKPKETEKKDGE